MARSIRSRAGIRGILEVGVLLLLLMLLLLGIVVRPDEL